MFWPPPKAPEQWPADACRRHQLDGAGVLPGHMVVLRALAESYDPQALDRIAARAQVSPRDALDALLDLHDRRYAAALPSGEWRASRSGRAALEAHDAGQPR